MAGLENLFTVEPTLPTLQGHKLPENPDRWSEALTTYLREQYADVATAAIVVEYKKREDQVGTALGALHVTDPESNKTVIVPFIIRKFELCPLDVWMETKSQAVHPLTKDTFKEQFFVTSTAEGLDARPSDGTGQYFNDPSTWNTTYPPLQGRYSYASAGYPMLDQLSDSFREEEAAEFRRTLTESPHLVAKFKKHGHAEILSKLAKKTYPNSNDFKQSAMNLIPTTAVSLRKDGYNEYSLLAVSEGLLDTYSQVRMDREECMKALAKITEKPQDFLHDVDQGGEKMLIIRKPNAGVFLYEELEAKPETANKFACYAVKTEDGVGVQGVVIPKVVDYAGNKRNQKLFISKSHSAMQPTIVGVPLKNNDNFMKALEAKNIHVGQTGTFVYLKDGEAIATVPVTIKAIEAGDKLQVVDMEGKKFCVCRQYSDYFAKQDPKKVDKGAPYQPDYEKRVYLESLGFTETHKGHYVIPTKMFWVPLDRLCDVSKSESEYMLKEAASKIEINPLTVRWTGIVYDVSGAEMEKQSMDERSVKLFLANVGCDMEKIAKITKRAKTLGKARVHGVERLGKKADKEKSVALLISKISSVAGSLRVNLIKEAAEIEDSATVDALLSLNFLNMENLAKFAGFRPVLEKVADYLAELLLASRLGLKEVNEASAVSAMQKILDIAEGLKKLEVSLKRPSTKTAAAKGKSVAAGIYTGKYKKALKRA
jgi:hypothetical protein